jgi:hypothetical protein
MSMLTLFGRPVQPRPMVKVDAPFLTSRPGARGTTRWFFQPPSRHLAKGWAAVRLHDKYERPIVEPLEAAAACRLLAEIYTRWLAGEEGYGPHRIDRLGRVVAAPSRKICKGRNFRPGQVGAMVRDYYQHDMFKTGLAAKTQEDYRVYLDILVEKFGDHYWQEISAGAAREWLVARALAGGASGAHSLYRTCRAFFGKARLLYNEVGHPGIVPEERNPFTSLNLSLPRATLIVWPRAAVEAFVAIADELGQPSIGDAVVMMSWLGTRRQDWLHWPATFFERELIAFRQEKTGKALVLPWSIVPALLARVEEAKRRRTADAVAASTFFHDRDGLPWKDGGAFRRAFNELREVLVERHPTFATRYYVGSIEGEPLRLRSADLTMRAMRHTCITLNHDAGVPRALIAGISGHELATIDDVMACYTASTADQAQAALQIRMDHEAKGVKA